MIFYCTLIYLSNDPNVKKSPKLYPTISHEILGFTTSSGTWYITTLPSLHPMTTLFCLRQSCGHRGVRAGKAGKQRREAMASYVFPINIWLVVGPPL